MFKLHPKLEEDSFFVADLKISRLLLMNDSNYLWLILVPKIENASELTDLNFEDQIEVLREINLCGKILKESFLVDKLNIAALGNVVPQLHIHVIGRMKNDVAFPKPVWNSAPAKSYAPAEAASVISKINELLG
jgi:diadenosine tetraphosphate (Ap4A) HIT family hydrolase